MNSDQRVTRPRIGIAAYGDITYDNRVRREAISLARAGYDVVLACLADSSDPRLMPGSIELRIINPATDGVLPRTPVGDLESSSRLRRVGRQVAWLRGYLHNLRAWGRSVAAEIGSVDLWQLDDLPALAAIAPLAGRTPIVYGSHELFADAGTAARMPAPIRMLLRMYERRLIQRVEAVVTINDAIADILRQRYRPREVITVYNCPDPPDPKPANSASDVRVRAGLKATDKLILYHGSLGPHRGIEQLIAAVAADRLASAHLVVVGIGDGGEEYQRMAEANQCADRVHFLDPIAPQDLIAAIASADVGGILIQPATLSHRLASPNKLFECFAAGVPVVASDVATMREIVLKSPAEPLGVVCDPLNHDMIVESLASLLEMGREETEVMRARCIAAARREWNWDSQFAKSLGLYRRLVS